MLYNLDILEETVCEGKIKSINCSEDDKVLKILPGGFYGAAHEYVCGGQSNAMENECKDYLIDITPSELSDLWVTCVFILYCVDSKIMLM